MGDGDMKTDGVLVLDEPTLGQQVELHEGTVGDALALIEAGKTITAMEFGLQNLAVSLRIDGRAVTVDELRAMPGRCMPALLRIASKAIALNNFFPAVPESEDEAPKP